MENKLCGTCNTQGEMRNGLKYFGAETSKEETSYEKEVRLMCKLNVDK
jgi:hypothetical protein